jgi:hypothetical protein
LIVENIGNPAIAIENPYLTESEAAFTEQRLREIFKMNSREIKS